MPGSRVGAGEPSSRPSTVISSLPIEQAVESGSVRSGCRSSWCGGHASFMGERCRRLRALRGGASSMRRTV